MEGLSEPEKIKRYKIFDNELQKINNEFISPGSKAKACRQVFEGFLSSFRELLYEDPFLKYFKLFSYAGSVVEGLSVGTSYKEFDVNIFIKFMGGVERRYETRTPGFVALKLNVPPQFREQKPDVVAVYEKWTNADGYVVPARFYAWAEGLIARNMNRIESLSQFAAYRMTLRKSGPAFTLHVVHRRDAVEFDVDIVLALIEDGKCFDGRWMMVPKRPKHIADNYDLLWRYSFPYKEKELLRGHNHMKNTIRLIKQIRDVCKMSYFASYFIKTLFLHEKEERDRKFWDQSLGFLLVEMLYKLRDALKNKDIRFYFNSDFNLLSSIKDHQAIDGRNRIGSVIDFIEKCCRDNNPTAIREILVPQGQFSEPVDSHQEESGNSLCQIL